MVRVAESLRAMDELGVLERVLAADHGLESEALNPHYLLFARRYYDAEPAVSLEWLDRTRSATPDCRVPFLKATYVRRMLELSRGHPVAVPLLDGYHMSTSAVYARDVLPIARRLLREERLRPLFLIREVDALIVSETALREMDPDLAGFRNCNTREAYEQALRDADLS